MSQERYGIRRFALLNTAGYSLGIFPLENPLSVYGANNLGKSASINALQFPILARMSDMSFGKYSLEQSRKFYFASDTSYILVEVALPHGPHVIGVAGRGPGGGFGHQFFAYQGELDLAHYQQDGTCLRQRELFKNLGQAGIVAYELKPEELRRLLVGGHTSIPLDLTLIPLRSTSEQSLKTFRALFINLLHMREITAAKLKQLFLDAFEHSLRSGSVDYIAATEEAFRDVRRMEQDYQALVAAGPLVEALASGVSQRELLRGKLHRLSPLLDNLLGAWQDYSGARKEELVIQAEHYKREQDGLQNEQRGGTAELMRLEREISEIQRWLGELAVLKNRFALVTDAKILEEQLLTAKDAHDELAGALAQSRQFSAEDLDERLRDLEKRLKSVKQQLDHADNNSYSRLREEFSQADVDRLMRLFNGQLFSLPLGEKGIQAEGDDWIKAVEAVLDRFKGDTFAVPGLSIDLSHIEPPALQALADRAALRDQKDRLERELKQLKTQQAVANDRAASKAQAEQLYQGVLDAQKALEDFRRSQTLSAEEPAKLEQLAEAEAAQDELKRASDAFTERVQQLSAKLQLVGRQLADLEAKERTLEDALRRRQLLPADLPFGTPFMEPVDDSLDNLLPLLNDYQDSWQALQRIDGQIDALYAQVRLKGVAKFDSEDDPERRLHLLVNAYAHRQDEALTLAKARRAAVTDIARTLRNIRSDYDNLEHQLALFNREINKRQVSNLESFRIVLAPNRDALKHIDQIIHSAGQYEEGETLSVFDLSQSADQDAKNEEAKDYLSRLVAASGNQLGLKDLFELAFEITKVGGQPVMHTDIDGAASNGTTMTIKALTNMYLLLHLMDREQAGKVRLPYYLDEAADIDERNQQALIETSLQLGFVPILASVKPQVSAHVAIDLEGGSGPSGIYIDEADWKFIKRRETAKAAQEEAEPA
ncbi:MULTISPECIES: Mks condensin complex protein MksF [unclassified Pseudomonas]|uniref:Mks condensin complex protein MksF n=1 Tax=unclassified Pseudomonas TaxID=196821 RepID=UPI0024482DA5|nr:MULTISPECIES: Mks condensin complex protein MksF [unclassified Pseudomonas]MDG9928839.1 Mks condensin complex protein MksF [Pseudomonas sp. GD04042]MDH0485678.1 Mks condensin complex protein MksF [Pseudomonas sp. GD04015]MDH0603280.1 Mks condensin complex protein MksF [Pseudomonas sp. GD03869]